MLTSTTLWLYFLVISGVIILPGMDMAFVMGSSLKGGYGAGFSAVGGTVAGGFLHMFIAASGISALLTLIPWAFTFMLFAGSLYIAYLGWGLIRVNTLSAPASGKGAGTMRHSFFGAFATSMLNPKAYIFMLAIFPQFVHIDHGSVWLQTSVLALITAATQICIYGSLAILAIRAQGALATQARTNVLLAKTTGAILIAAAAVTLYGGLSKLT